MSSGLTYTGAIARGLAYPPSLPRDVVPAAAREPAAAIALDPVMPERAPDELRLFQMSSLDRIQAEADMMARAAVRRMRTDNQARAYVSATATLVDLRV